MNVKAYLLTTRQEVTCLGVQLDWNRRFGVYLEKVCGKADALIGAFRPLLPNVNMLTGSVRKLHYGVRESVALHAAPALAEVVEIKKNSNILKTAQRFALTRVSTAYRTVSHAAPCVLIGIMPIYFTIELLTEKYRIKKEDHQE